MIIHQGYQETEKRTPSIDLYQIRGSQETDTLTIQVPASSSLLNSRDSFLLIDDDGKSSCNHLWVGTKSNPFERAIAERVNSIIGGGRALNLVQEGAEEDTFWDLLGGKNEYCDAAKVKEDFKPKFFQFSNASGMVSADPIFHFSQDDLLPETVVLLDTYNEIFLWIGSKSKEGDKKIAMETAIHYLKKVSGDRPLHHLMVSNIKEGSETLTFVSIFHGWQTPVNRVGDVLFVLIVCFGCLLPSVRSSICPSSFPLASLECYGIISQ